MEPYGSDGLSRPSGIPLNPYADPTFSPQEEINPFSPPSAIERPATQNLGFGYWVPMVIVMVFCGYAASISSQIGIFGLASYILAAVHGVRYQYRLSQRERAGLPLRRHPDIVVFLLSSIVGGLGVFGSAVAFFTVCYGGFIGLSGVALIGPRNGSEALGVFIIVILTIVAIVSAVLVPSLLTRLFLPRKPQAEKDRGE